VTTAPAPVAERQRPRERQFQQEQQQQPAVEPRVQNRGNFIEGRTIEGVRHLPPPATVAKDDQKSQGDAPGNVQRPERRSGREEGGGGGGGGGKGRGRDRNN
jgi:hypothetical protein